MGNNTEKTENGYYIFIDANIWLSLYRPSSNEVKDFEKLYDAIKKADHITLIITQQLIDEVLKNRCAVIAASLDRFNIDKIKFPSFCKEIEGYSEIMEAFSDIEDKHKEFMKKITEFIQEEKLPSDKIINEIFKCNNKNIKHVSSSDKLLKKAYYRYLKGNPPKKKDDRYGDAINWESLLETVPLCKDLYIISEDDDFYEKLKNNNEKIFSFYLLKEWQKAKQSKVYAYTSLNKFVKDKLPSVYDEIKNSAITALKESGSFLATHNAIRRLNELDGWSPDLVDQLCKIALDNNQIRYIISDDDVHHFYKKIINTSFIKSQPYTTNVQNLLKLM